MHFMLIKPIVLVFYHHLSYRNMLIIRIKCRFLPYESQVLHHFEYNMQTNAILPADVSDSFPVVIYSAPQHSHFIQTHGSGTMTVSRYIHLK